MRFRKDWEMNKIVCWLSAGVSSFIAGYLCKDIVTDYIYIDVAEVKHGKWHCIDENYNAFECSNCKDAWCMEERNMKENNYNFCPNCGAKMDKEV